MGVPGDGGWSFHPSPDPFDDRNALFCPEGARLVGIVLHVAGLGADVDAGYPRDVAGSAERLHLSPGPAELGAIYTGIARSIPCPPEASWGRP